MRLMIVTQKVDRKDPILGFFHRWIEEFAKHYEFVTVLCLEMGEYNLPSNVKVLSLGKEKLKIKNWKLKIKFRYILNFYQYIWQERKNYDVVFVHMNQEYILLGGLLWRFFGKKIFLWRNHGYGNVFTKVAVFLSDKIFYTSPRSFTARFKKSVKMPVGIDTDFFKPDPSVTRTPNSILFLGRISPIKKVLEFVEWFNLLGEKFTATVAGAALPKDKAYEEFVLSRALDKNRIKFIGAVNQEQALKLYQTHEIYVNKTPAGSFDKTIVEAAACGMKLMVDNPDAQGIRFEDHSLVKLMQRFQEEMK